MSELKLNSPWIQYYNKLKVFFEKDDSIKVTFVDGEEEERTIKIFVEGENKAAALATLLPVEKSFGNVNVKIEVIPANDNIPPITLFRTAFEGNGAFDHIETVYPPLGEKPFNYILFKKEVVQYWNDNLADFNGLNSTLYQCLAKEIFEDCNLNGIFFCTNKE